ncbi:MAG: hypothetical protein WBN22_03810 [Verrucomicrobiia bacterium]
MNQELSSFAARLRRAIQDRDAALRRPDSAARCPYQESKFNSLALELFALQFTHNTAYRTICEARGLTPDIVEHWTQIPAVPAAAFKELEISCIPPEKRTAVFYSSGTTGQKSSRHYHCAESLEVYEASLSAWFLANVLPDLRFAICDLRLICLTPPPGQTRHSSLVHMFETVRSRVCESADHSFFGTVAADGSWGLDLDGVIAALNSSLITRHPSLLLGTAFSFVHLLDFMGEHNLRFQLSAGSRVMETGGYKNRSRSMPKVELHALITERLGVPPENIVYEYGMSELSSQAYDSVTSDEWRVAGNDGTSHHLSPATRHFHFSPWARVQIVSPETGREVADGGTGLICVFDLANVFSVMAVQTEDLGVRRGDGFELLGRAQMAEPRGCSLMMEGSAWSLP